MSKPKQSRSSKKKKTKAESIVVKTVSTPALSPTDQQDAVDRFISEQALYWHSLPSNPAEAMEGLRWAGWQVQSWNETFLATTGGDGPTLLVYLPNGPAQNADLAAIQAAVAGWRQNGPLPARLKVLVGTVTEEWTQAHGAELEAQAIVYGLGEYDQGRPLVSLGLKGLLEVELEVKTLSQDAPSAYSEIMPAASWVLVRALDALKSDSQEIKIENFEDDLVALPAEESRQLLKSVGEHSQRLVERLKRYGLKNYIFELSDALVLQTEYRVPTVNVSSIECGDFDRTRLKLPATARARLDIHLLPDQQPEKIFADLESYLADRNFEGLQVRQLPGSVSPTRTPLDNPFIQAAMTALTTATGQPALIAPLSPFSGELVWLKAALGPDVPALCLSLGQTHPDPDDLVTQARIIAHLLPVGAMTFAPTATVSSPLSLVEAPVLSLESYSTPSEVYDELTFELPPEFEPTLQDVEISLPSAPLATEEDLVGRD